jgi:hypothetical protein
MRIAVLGLVLAFPLAAAAQPIVPGQPLGQPGPAPSLTSPQDSDILRRSTRSLPGDNPPPPVAPGPTAGPPSSGLGGLVQPDGRIVVTRDLCNQVNVEHQPAPDVTYRPGTDVYGRPVAPADLPSTGTNNYGGLGSRTSTDILINPQAGGLNRGGVIGETYVGRVTVDANGRVAINGQPVQQDQSQLKQLCARAGY